MDDTMIFLIFESLQNLNGESSYQTEWNSLKIIVLYKLIKINTQAFKCNQKMLPKNNIIFNSDYIILIIFVMMIQKFQYSQFNTRLILKFLFISNNLDSINLLCFMIKTLYSLSKTSLPKKFKDFINAKILSKLKKAQVELQENAGLSEKAGKSTIKTMI